MYWCFNYFLGCIYTIYHIVYIVFLVLNWLSNLEFWLPNKGDQVARIGVMGGEGLSNSGNARKKTFFFNWGLPLANMMILSRSHWKTTIWVREGEQFSQKKTLKTKTSSKLKLKTNEMKCILSFNPFFLFQKARIWVSLAWLNRIYTVLR